MIAPDVATASVAVGGPHGWEEWPMPERLCCPVDAYLLLERGGKLLMLRRAPGAYAAGLLCPPSVHLAS